MFEPQIADEDIESIYARGDFEHVRYAVVADPALGHVLSADVVEKSLGAEVHAIWSMTTKVFDFGDVSLSPP